MLFAGKAFVLSLCRCKAKVLQTHVQLCSCSESATDTDNNSAVPASSLYTCSPLFVIVPRVYYLTQLLSVASYFIP
jgi:hypothetical protein